MNKRKVLNDPVYGFITIPDQIIFDLIEHPYFQRLRRISQLGLSCLVYPGAHHHRFHHALGAAHLMTEALDNLAIKGHDISPQERLAATAAIVLHDIGHGPFSHALEHELVAGMDHEVVGLLFMERLNEHLGGALDMAIRIFKKEYDRPFLWQLVSGQLDVDRLDYLQRDSFYTGVSEGVVGSHRIIKLLDVHEDRLVIEEKGIYSIEKFLVARRLMYWQVYLHKTVVAAEFLLAAVMRRARELVMAGEALFGSPALAFFLAAPRDLASFQEDPEVLEHYAQLDDYDVLGAIKVWMNHEDPTLSYLSRALIDRRLPKIRLTAEPVSEEELARFKQSVRKHFGVGEHEAEYYVMSGRIQNHAYDREGEHIRVRYKDGRLLDVTEASDNLNISALSDPVEKHFLMVPREVL
jgi:HD superfamily phosphohydrolase